LTVGHTGDEELREKELTLWRKGFANSSANLDMVYATNMSSLVDSTESDIGFDLVIIEIDCNDLDDVKRSYKAAKILRLLNYSAPIIGLTSYGNSNLCDLEEEKLQGEKDNPNSLCTFLSGTVGTGINECMLAPT
jgi:hypothetical protein